MRRSHRIRMRRLADRTRDPMPAALAAADAALPHRVAAVADVAAAVAALGVADAAVVVAVAPLAAVDAVRRAARNTA